MDDYLRSALNAMTYFDSDVERLEIWFVVVAKAEFYNKTVNIDSIPDYFVDKVYKYMDNQLLTSRDRDWKFYDRSGEQSLCDCLSTKATATYLYSDLNKL